MAADSGQGVVTKASFLPCLGSDAGYQPEHPPGACPWGLGWVLEVRVPRETESQTKLSSLHGGDLIVLRHHFHYILLLRRKSLWPAHVQGEGNKKFAAMCDDHDTSL